MTQLIKYTKQFKLKMSTKDEFSLNEDEMKRFKNQVATWWIFEKEDWTLINPSFFITAEPFQAMDWLNNYQRKKLAEKEDSIKSKHWKVTPAMRLEWANKLLKWEPLFN